MKKFDMSQIMTRAWAIVKEKALDISTALRLAWFEAKSGIKAYAFRMNETRRAAVETYLTALGCAILSGETDDVHEIHKHNIIRQALQAPVKNGTAILDGKSVGLLKFAMRQAA